MLKHLGTMMTLAACLTLGGLSLGGLTACDDGGAEEIGEDIDEAIEDAGEGLEDAGEEIEDALESK